MANTVTVDLIEKLQPLVHSVATEHARRLRGLRYCDIRLEVREEKAAVSENGLEKQSTEDTVIGLGVRAISGGRAAAPGYYGVILGAHDLDSIERVLADALGHAHQRALASARQKSEARSRFSTLGQSLYDTELAPVQVVQDRVPPRFRIDPRSVPLGQVVKLSTDASKAAAGTSGQIVYSAAMAQTSLIRELFCSSEGASIDQSYAQTEGMVFLVSRGQHGNLEIYDFTGHQGGWEVLAEGYRSQYVDLPDFLSFARKLGADAVEISNAPPLKPPDKEVVVVTDPHFNALVCHEVVGHPSELDRALKYETSYAGRSWFFKDLHDNQVGKQVASPLVSAFSDPTLDGFGSYKYDHDGTPARRAYHIRNGVYEEFLNNRQTAGILGVQPNGSFRATEAYLIPLIRMSNTVFAPGQSDPQRIISEVEEGYYVVGHRIPSVAESRENFRITAMKVYEIRNGQLGRLYRDGGVTSDSRDYFMRIDAVGNDFRMFPIPNCGKGQPMQAKRMSNGGPTMRGIARLTGPGGRG